MALGLGLGYFLGGAAEGYGRQRDLMLREEEARRRQEQFSWQRMDRERADHIRRAAAETLGRTGEEQTTGYDMSGAGMTGGLDSDGFTPQKSVYTEDQAWKDYAKRTAGLDSQISAAARVQGMQVKGLARQEREADLSETLNQVRMQFLTGDKVGAARRLLSVHGKMPDGEQGGVTMVNGQPHIAVINEQTRDTQLVPLDDATFDKLWRQMYSAVGPNQMAAAHRMGMDERRTAAVERQASTAERQVGVAEQNAQTMENYRADQGRLINAQITTQGAMANWYNRRGDASGGGSGLKLPEQAKIYLNGLERQAQVLSTQLSKAETPEEQARLANEIRRVRDQMFQAYRGYNLLPEDVTRTQYLGLPDPIQVARSAMAAARTAQEFQASMNQFDQIYGDAPEAQQARMAMMQFMNQQFGPKNQSESAVGGLAHRAGQTVGGFVSGGLQTLDALQGTIPRKIGGGIMDFGRGLIGR